MKPVALLLDGTSRRPAAAASRRASSSLIGGGAGPKLFAQIAEYADGWMPIGGAGMAAELKKLRGLLEERGRDPEQLHVVPMGVFPSEKKLTYYQESGVTECVLRVPCAMRDEVLPVLDDYVQYIDRY